MQPVVDLAVGEAKMAPDPGTQDNCFVDPSDRVEMQYPSGDADRFVGKIGRVGRGLAAIERRTSITCCYSSPNVAIRFRQLFVCTMLATRLLIIAFHIGEAPQQTLALGPDRQGIGRGPVKRSAMRLPKVCSYRLRVLAVVTYSRSIEKLLYCVKSMYL
jgi:hypothetical protein